MQDIPSLRKEYEVKHKGQGSPGYPQALLETIIERGTGQIHRFKLSNRHVSELALFYPLLDELPPTLCYYWIPCITVMKSSPSVIEKGFNGSFQPKEKGVMS